MHASIIQTFLPILIHVCRGKQLKVGAEDLQLSDNEQHERGKRLHRAKFDLLTRGVGSHAAIQRMATSAGAKDVSVVHKFLPYCSYNNTYLIPVAHTLLFGVVASFICCLLRNPAGSYGGTSLTQEARKTIEERGKHVGAASDFGRKYKDVIKYHNSFTMEDWLHFVLAYSHFVFMGEVLPHDLKLMWELLQTAVEHYCHGVSFSDQGAIAAAEALRQYAVMVEKKVVEKKFPDSMCTYNLHIAVCRLPRQEKECGSAARVTEFIVERAMQSFKEGSGRRVSKDPEKVYCNNFFLEEAVMRLHKKHPGIPSFSSLCGDVGMRVMSGQRYDEEAAGDNVQLLGRGDLPSDAVMKQEIVQAVLRLAAELDMVDTWTADVVDKVVNQASPSRRTASSKLHVMVFARGEHQGDVFISEAYGRCTRTNYFLQVPYMEGSTKNHYVGLLRYFVKVPFTEDFPAPPTAPEGPEPTALRFAVMSFFQRLDTDGRPLVHDDANGVAPKLQVISLAKARDGESAYPVLLEEIGSKMIATRAMGGLIYCSPYVALTTRQ